MKHCRGCGAETCERFHQGEVYFPWCHGCPVEHAELFAKSDRGNLDSNSCPIGAVVAGLCTGTHYTIVPGTNKDEGGLCLGKDRRCPMPVTLVSLPKPIADEVVELGTLKRDEWFEFAELLDPMFMVPMQVAGVSPKTDRHIRVQHNEWDFHRTRKVRRVPAPTPAQQPSGRPPCDACGEESVTNRGRNESVFGHHLCAAHWKWSANQINEASARRAKTSGSTQPGAGHESILTDPNPFQLWGDRPAPKAEPRWHTEDPTRIAALEAKLAGQVASGGQDCEPARSLIERADDLRREAEARQSSKWGGERVQWRDENGNLCAKVLNEPGISAGPVFNRRDYRPRPRRK